MNLDRDTLEIIVFVAVAVILAVLAYYWLSRRGEP